MPKKFRIPHGTMISAGGYRVFTEDGFQSRARHALQLRARFGRRFDLPLSPATPTPTSPATVTASASARRPTESASAATSSARAKSNFPRNSRRTPEAANAGPRIGPVVINEIHYHPDAGDDEFVELRNITASAVRALRSRASHQHLARERTRLHVPHQCHASRQRLAADRGARTRQPFARSMACPPDVPIARSIRRHAAGQRRATGTATARPARHQRRRLTSRSTKCATTTKRPGRRRRTAAAHRCSAQASGLRQRPDQLGSSACPRRARTSCPARRRSSRPNHKARRSSPIRT